jgi:hypothetical protein
MALLTSSLSRLLGIAQVTMGNKITIVTKVTKIAWEFPGWSLSRAETHTGLYVKYLLLFSSFKQNWNRITIRVNEYIFLTITCEHPCEPGSSVSIVSGYGLDDRVIEVRSRAEAKGFFL